MKPFQISKVLACACAASLLLAGCSLFHSGNQTASSAVPAASFGSSSSAVSQEEASGSSQAESALSSQASSQAMSRPASSEAGPVLTIRTDSEAFNAKFKDNPIDKAYIAASNKALSTVDMVNVSQDYTKIWQKEVDHAWSQLKMRAYADNNSVHSQAIMNEQQKWENGKEAALKKIGKDAAAAGGSMAQVNAASQVMDFYRSRAAQLYRELYDYNKNFDYAYSAK